MRRLHWQKLILSALLVIAVPVFASLPEPPSRLPGVGQPVPDSDIQSKLLQFCRPIAAWSRPAYELCLEAGVSVNLAVREYHEANCSALDGRDICQQTRLLYQRNFRLWDGSVDNVGRANAQLGATGAQYIEVSSALAQCKQRYREALATHRSLLDEMEGWLMLRQSAERELSAQGLTRLVLQAQENLQLSGFTPPEASVSCQQAMKGEHGLLSRIQAEVREQLTLKQNIWQKKAAALEMQSQCAMGREAWLREWQQAYITQQQDSQILHQRVLLASFDYVNFAVDEITIDTSLRLFEAQLAALGSAKPISDSCPELTQNRDNDEADLLLDQWRTLWRDQWISDYLLSAQRLKRVSAEQSLAGYWVLLFTLLGLFAAAYFGYRRMAKKANSPNSCCQ